MKWPILALMLLGSSLLGAALGVGIMLVAEPWADPAPSALGRSETEATVIAETWTKDWMLYEDSAAHCEALEYNSGDWFLTCYESLPGEESPRVTATVRLPNDAKMPQILQCDPSNACEKRNLIPETP